MSRTILIAVVVAAALSSALTATISTLTTPRTAVAAPATSAPLPTTQIGELRKIRKLLEEQKSVRAARDAALGHAHDLPRRLPGRQQRLVLPRVSDLTGELRIVA